MSRRSTCRSTPTTTPSFERIVGIWTAVLYRPPDPQLCQGDIVAGVPHLHMKPPVEVVRRTSTKTGPMLQPHEPENPPPGGFAFEKGRPEQVVVQCQMAIGIVISHGCEIDKDSKHRIVALVRPLAPVAEEHRDVIRENRNHSYFYLPPHLEVLDESYVDFRRLSCIDPQLVSTDKRLASLTPDGLAQFLATFFVYITRADVADLDRLIGSR